MVNNPLVTVIMPAYNEEKLIATAINSIQNQIYSNLEILVIDNGSTDRTVEIVNDIAKTDDRVRLLRCSIKGPAAARNAGIKEARGEYIVNMDADDYSTKDRIQKLLEVCRKNKKSVVGSNLDIVDAQGSIVQQIAYPENNFDIRKAFKRIYNRGSIMPGTVMAQREIFLRFPYNETFKYLEDWDFILRIADDSAVKFSNVQESLYKYHLNPQSVSFDWRLRNRYNIMIWYNQIQRTRGKNEALTLKAFETRIRRNPFFMGIYGLLIMLKYIQRKMWIIKTKRLLKI